MQEINEPIENRAVPSHKGGWWGEWSNVDLTTLCVVARGRRDNFALRWVSPAAARLCSLGRAALPPARERVATVIYTLRLKYLPGSSIVPWNLDPFKIRKADHKLRNVTLYRYLTSIHPGGSIYSWNLVNIPKLSVYWNWRNLENDRLLFQSEITSYLEYICGQTYIYDAARIMPTSTCLAGDVRQGCLESSPYFTNVYVCCVTDKETDLENFMSNKVSLSIVYYYQKSKQ